MAKNINPNDHPVVSSPWGFSGAAVETNAEITLGPLTDECLRDIARNEACSRVWRKAAIKFLMKRNHRFQFHEYFRELRSEILEEQDAEKEVKAVVEGAIEGTIE